MTTPGHTWLLETTSRRCLAVWAVFVVAVLALVLHAGCVRRPQEPVPLAPGAPSPTPGRAELFPGATESSRTGGTRTPSSSAAPPAEVDAAQKAAAREVVAGALGWDADGTHVSEFTPTDDGGICGHVRCEGEVVEYGFVVAQVDARLALTSLQCTSAPEATDHDIGATELLRSARTFAARACHRWTPDSMQLASQHETRLSGPACWFEWEQVTAEGYYTGNSLSVVVRSDTGDIDAYSARFAKLPLREPTIAQDVARALADTLVRAAMARRQVEFRCELVSHRCLLCSPLANDAPGPVWEFEYELTPDMPHPPAMMQWIAIDAITGEVVEQDPPPR